MKNMKLFLTLMTFSFFSLTAFASAESDVKPSYANKKSGQVAFKAKEEKASKEGIAAQPTDPSQIEPAAGAEQTSEETKQENKLADSMKLPRKN